MLGHRADAPEAARVFMGDEPVGSRGAAFGQHALKVLEAAGDEVVHDADADARTQRLELRDRAGALEAGRRAIVEFAYIVERGRKRVLLDVADKPASFQRPDVRRRAVVLEVGGARVEFRACSP